MAVVEHRLVVGIEDCIVSARAASVEIAFRSLGRRAHCFDRKYDYRYSRLTHVFGKLLHEGRVREEELRGLREDKLEAIRSCAKFLARMDGA